MQDHKKEQHREVSSTESTINKIQKISADIQKKNKKKKWLLLYKFFLTMYI